MGQRGNRGAVFPHFFRSPEMPVLHFGNVSLRLDRGSLTGLFY
ncbi:MAG: hypothetical protein ACRC62_30745 [Microcoleus sp.]